MCEELYRLVRELDMEMRGSRDPLRVLALTDEITALMGELQLVIILEMLAGRGDCGNPLCPVHGPNAAQNRN